MNRAPDNLVLWEGEHPARVQFVVLGNPVPQGSKRHVGKGIMIESSRLRPWRQQVIDAVHGLGLPTGMQGAVQAELTFYFKRPKSHFGSGRNAEVMKEWAPEYVAQRPDIDKLARAVLDGLTESGLLRDDGQVSVLIVEKRYGSKPGLKAVVRTLP